MATILIVDDDRKIRDNLASYLREIGHEVDTASEGSGALARLEETRADVVLSDVRMAGMDGLALLGEVRRRNPDAVVVLMTAYGTVPQAVEAIKAGAYDYLTKPFSLDQVRALLDRVLEVLALRRENRRLRTEGSDAVWLESRNPQMRRALETARQVAGTDVTLLLTGESGTGKTVLARQIHGWSRRAASPFVTIACTTLAEHLLESELFGHVKGAFTGAWKDKPGRVEAAGGGTLFLDEVGELPLELQAKLLRFLEERRFERVGGVATIAVDARVIAATNRELEAEVRAGKFREDLFYRLNVVAIELPPLRDRREDLPALADHLLPRLSARHSKPAAAISDEARRVLLDHDWPGNVRELVNVLERALVLSADRTISAEALPDRLLAPRPSSPPTGATLVESREEHERTQIRRALSESATLEEAAERLGIDVTTLWRKRKRYGIE